MRKLVVFTIVCVFLVGGYIVYLEIDKRKFFDGISSVSPVIDQPVNVPETTREVTRSNKETKLQEVDPDELLAAVNRIPEQFGYSEASTTYAKLEAKKMSGEELTIDERVTLLEAQLYLYPDEATRRSLIYQKWIQSKGSNLNQSDALSDENIAELRELGIPVVHRGNVTIVNPPPDSTLKEHVKLSGKSGHLIEDFLSAGESSLPVFDTVSSEGIGEDTDFAPAGSEETLVMPEPKVMDDHVHHEDGHVHEPPTLQPPTPTAAKGVEANGWKGLSPEQREQAKAFFDQYGTKEGLRRFREMDPEAARQFERERRKPPVPSEPNDELPTR